MKAAKKNIKRGANMKRTFLSLFSLTIMLTICLSIFPLVARADPGQVNYIDETGTTKTVIATAIDASTATLTAGWYIVASDII